MRHQPKKLALLISLIGAGVSPYACARTEMRTLAPEKSLLDATVVMPSETALDRTRWTPGFIWRADEETLQVAVPLESLRTVTAFGVEWAPGEIAEQTSSAQSWSPRPDSEAQAAPKVARSDAHAAAPMNVAPAAQPDAAPSTPKTKAKVAAATGRSAKAAQTKLAQPKVAQAKSETKQRVQGKWHRVRVLAKSLTAPHENVRPDPGAFTVSDTEASLASGFTVKFEPIPLTSPDAQAASVHADRLMDSLAAILMDVVPAYEPQPNPATVVAQASTPAEVTTSKEAQPTLEIAAAPDSGVDIELPELMAPTPRIELLVATATAPKPTATPPQPTLEIAAAPDSLVNALLTEVIARSPRIDRQPPTLEIAAAPESVVIALPTEVIARSPRIDKKPLALEISAEPESLVNALLAEVIARSPRIDKQPARVMAAAPESRVDALLAEVIAPSPRIVHRDIAVAPQSSKVLRSLEAILSNERNEVGAIKQEPSDMVVATHTEKIWATLGNVVGEEPGQQGRAPSIAPKALQAAGALEDAQSLATSATQPQPSIEEPSAHSGRDQHLTLEDFKSTDVATRGIPDLIPIGEVTYVCDSTHDTTWFDAGHVDIDLSLPMAAQCAAAVTTAVNTPSQTAKERPLLADQQALTNPPAAPSHERVARPSPFGGELVAVSEAALDGVRGGFVGEGLNISFGIERAVYINGSLVTTTSMNVGDLGKITAGRAGATVDPGTIALVQNGAGNTVTTGAIPATAISTVVQNTLDGQKIQNVTVVNATVNSLGVVRGLNFQSSLRGAVIDSLRR